MFTKLLIYFALLLFPLLGAAQTLTGFVHDEAGTPLVGANVYWQGGTEGTFTETDGTFSLALPPTLPADLIVSYLGYAPDTLAVTEAGAVDIELQASETQTTTVVVNDTRQGTFISTVNPIKTDVITEKELGRSACCDLAGCFNTQGSVQPTTTNIVTSAKELRILGLSGVYNQVLIDGFPLIQGSSYTYGISGIPGTLIKNIFVAKGANSVLQGYESIAGQINVVLKRPEPDEKLLLNAYANSFGERQYNANYAHRWNDWGTLLVGHVTQPADRIDRDGDRFLDLPLINRYTFYNKWTYRDAGEWGWYHESALRYLNEERRGGQVDFNAATDRGGTDVYGQWVRIAQPEFYAKTGYRMDDFHHFTLLISGFRQDQDAYYGTTRYVVDHANAYANLQYERNWGGAHQLKAGVSQRFSDLREDISFGDDDLNRGYAGNYRNRELIAGTFVENVFNWNDDALTLITGLRYDRHNRFGGRATPRILLRGRLGENTVARASAGTGWRTVQLFAENVQLLAGSRDVVIAETLRPEAAFNYGFNLTRNYYGAEMEAQLSFDAYRTTFQNQIFPDYNASPVRAIVRNFTGTSISNGFQGEIGLAFYDRIGTKFVYNYLDVYRVIDGERRALPFNAKHRLVATFSYEPLSKGWHFDANLHWTGRQRLADTEDGPEEFRQPDYSRPFSYLNVQFTKTWPRLEVYGGCENLFDFRQTFPIRSWQDPFGPYFDTANVWGPTRGREWYLGVRYRVGKS